MGGLTRADERVIRVRVTLPAPNVEVGGLSIDPLALIGVDIGDILSSLLYAPIEHNLFPTPSKVYPLALPHGEGASVPVPKVGGELGFFNEGGMLVIAIPAMLWPALRNGFGNAIVSADQKGQTVRVQVRLTKGEKHELRAMGWVLGVEAA